MTDTAEVCRWCGEPIKPDPWNQWKHTHTGLVYCDAPGVGYADPKPKLIVPPPKEVTSDELAAAAVLADYKKRVRQIATKHAHSLEWCAEIDRVLMEIGIPEGIHGTDECNDADICGDDCNMRDEDED